MILAAGIHAALQSGESWPKQTLHRPAGSSAPAASSHPKARAAILSVLQRQRVLLSVRVPFAVQIDQSTPSVVGGWHLFGSQAVPAFPMLASRK